MEAQIIALLIIVVTVTTVLAPMAKTNRSFTLIEIIVTVSIILLLTGLTIPRYNTYTQQLKLKSEMEQIADIIELAKKKAISSELFDLNCNQFTGYRVTLNSNSAVLKFGCANVYQNINTFLFDSGITIIAGAGDIDFPPLAKNLSVPISYIRLKHTKLNVCQDIYISRIGIITTSTSTIECGAMPTTTPTVTNTPMPQTPTVTPTGTLTATPIPTWTLTPTVTPTRTPTPTPINLTPTPTRTPTPIRTPTPTNTPIPTPTFTPTPIL